MRAPFGGRNGNGNLSATDQEGARQTYGIPWESVGGAFTSGPAVASWGVNRLDLFGRGQDNSLWIKTWNGSSWSGWQWLGGELTSAPDVVSWGPGRLDIFYTGTDTSIRHSWYINGW